MVYIVILAGLPELKTQSCLDSFHDRSRLLSGASADSITPLQAAMAFVPCTYTTTFLTQFVRLRYQREPSSCRSLHQSTAILRTFEASDFEIRRIVGQQSFATITDWEYYTPAPFAPTRTTEPSGPAIRLYEARITRAIPELFNARVLLKEFLPAGVKLGVTEAEAYDSLYATVPETTREDIPAALLLGSFLTDSSFDSPAFVSSWRARFPRSPEPPVAHAPFLVFRWQGLSTALSLAAPPPVENPSSQWFDNWFPANLVRRKSLYLLAFMSKALFALRFLHSQAGFIHRSIGLASIMVNTTEWRYASNLDVKLRDFGFAKPISALAQGKDLERARRAEAFTPTEISAFYFAEDIYALGYAFVELIFSVFSGRPVTQDVFKKLFEDTFSFSTSEIRQYCAEDPDWSDAVAFLDGSNKSGWDLLLSMLKARQNYKSVSLEMLCASQFLTT